MYTDIYLFICITVFLPSGDSIVYISLRNVQKKSSSIYVWFCLTLLKPETIFVPKHYLRLYISLPIMHTNVIFSCQNDNKIILFIIFEAFKLYSRILLTNTNKRRNHFGTKIVPRLIIIKMLTVLNKFPKKMFNYVRFHAIIVLTSHCFNYDNF